jgi:hypothetical protein
MTTQTYEFRIGASVPLDEARDTLRLALLAAEALHGEGVAVDGAHHLDTNSRACRIDGSTRPGRDLALLFSRFLAREFGPDNFRVKRVEGSPAKIA